MVVITGAARTRKGTTRKRGVVTASVRERPSFARASSTTPCAVSRRLVRMCGKRR
ncbi:hypothetical protein IFDJLNFL_4202 [Methylobacterium dankookense]|uniref:Uncharacterized protein n=1 Tax=Methylobacterium dankookense TaxID=560405 RepID=A0ABQ4RKJ1_9HYPH|nr:hypothetical protein IFDJLNFL_4202 [Methylobacterium dankookense]